MTTDRLAEIKARTAAAPLGPWRVGLDDEHGFYAVVYDVHGISLTGSYPGDQAAAFIAAARSDVPDLVAALEDAYARIADLELELAVYKPVGTIKTGGTS